MRCARERHLALHERDQHEEQRRRSRKPNSSTTPSVDSARGMPRFSRAVDDRRAEVREDRADQERRQHRSQAVQPERR